jgi:cell division protease FtsH
VLLEGAPGLGKTLLATEFIKVAGVKSFTLRRNKGGDDFISQLEATFKDAADAAPSIVFLDDMDKFAPDSRDSEEFVVLQAKMDEVKGKDVFVIATVNDTDYIPYSLLRAGRFDRHITVSAPTGADSERIIRHYLSEKPMDKDIDYTDVSKMLYGKSCAELESVINAAAISAAYSRSSRIGIEHVMGATLREAYGITEDCDEMSETEREETAYHEAGHALISEVIQPGSVGLLSLSSSRGSDKGGFMLRCENYERRAHLVLVALGGKAASEIKFGRVASGTVSDLQKAISHIYRSTTGVGAYGLSAVGGGDESEALDSRQEIVVEAELERHLYKAREIVAENREFLDALAKELYEKRTLLYSDIRRIREACTIKPAIVA